MKLLVTSLSIAVAASTLVAAAPASADAPQSRASLISAPSDERLELARRFITATGPADSLIDVIRAGFWQAATKDIAGEEQRAAAEDHLDRLFARLEPNLRQAMPVLLERYAQVYAREFSADELRQMTAFAESAAGKHYLSRGPSLESDAAVLEAQAEILAQLTPVIEDFRKEMCAKRAEERIAAGDTKATCPLAAESDARPS